MGENFDPYYKWLGIPPKDQPPHHYRLLGIEIFEKDREVIDAAANRLMGYLKDLAVGDEGAYTQNLLNEIARARICLLNKKKKSEYDQQLHSRVEQEEARKPAIKGPPPKAPKRTVPPLAAPPSAAPPSAAPPSAAPPSTAIPPIGPKLPGPVGSKASDSDESLPVLLPDEPEVSASPDGPFNFVTLQDKGPPAAAKGTRATAKDSRPPAKSSPGVKVESRSPQKVREPAIDASSSATGRRHSRGVYIAAAMIAIVGGIGLLLIIIMSYLLLTTESNSGGSTNATDDPPAVASESVASESVDGDQATATSVDDGELDASN